MYESSDVMKDIAELIKEYGYITPEITAKNVRLYSAYKQKTLNVISGIVKKCAVEENPKSEIDRYQAA